MLARAVLDGLRLLSRDTPVLLAVDDAQWLDRPSAAVLEFCIRRLDQAAVSIVLTLRGEVPVFPLGLEQALSPGSLACAQLGGVSPGAIAAILRSRLGVTFPRSTLRRLYDACGGNPLYALESGRALLELGRACAAGEPIPIPPGISDLVRPRLRGLSPDALRVGRLIAASADPRERVIRAASSDQESWTAMDQVIDDGLIRRDSDTLRFTHPLLGPGLYAEMTMSERRDVHRRLAASAVDIEDRAWHLALGADLARPRHRGMEGRTPPRAGGHRSRAPRAGLVCGHVCAVRSAQPDREPHELPVLHGDRDAGDLPGGGGSDRAGGPAAQARAGVDGLRGRCGRGAVPVHPVALSSTGNGP